MDNLKELIKLAFLEDVGKGDITSQAIIPKTKQASALIIAKQEGILCGIDVAEEVFKIRDKKIKFIKEKNDGDSIKKGDVIAKVDGKALALLACERIVLNFLQHLSGVATTANAYVIATKKYPVKILDTRKTLPGFRALEKYAVKTGGAENHRLGLHDMVLIKDNHIKVAGSITAAVERVKKNNKIKTKIEVECKSFDEVKEALKNEIDMIMFDNMSYDEMEIAVGWVKEHNKKTNAAITTEASGGVMLENIKEIAKTGVDYISIGSALTLSAKALDISMKIVVE